MTSHQRDHGNKAKSFGFRDCTARLVITGSSTSADNGAVFTESRKRGVSLPCHTFLSYITGSGRLQRRQRSRGLPPLSSSKSPDSPATVTHVSLMMSSVPGQAAVGSTQAEPNRDTLQLRHARGHVTLRTLVPALPHL